MRKLIATAWLLGTFIGVTAMAVFLFGCCVLPFHATLHRMLPICKYAAGILSGGQHSAPATPASSAPSKAPPAFAKGLPAKAVAHDVRQIAEQFLLARSPYNQRALRNLRSLGALRVDDDIGLHTLLATFLI
jgi:hypothetical protein